MLIGNSDATEGSADAPMPPRRLGLERPPGLPISLGTRPGAGSGRFGSRERGEESVGELAAERAKVSEEALLPVQPADSSAFHVLLFVFFGRSGRLRFPAITVILPQGGGFGRLMAQVALLEPSAQRGSAGGQPA